MMDLGAGVLMHILIVLEDLLWRSQIPSQRLTLP